MKFLFIVKSWKSPFLAIVSFMVMTMSALPAWANEGGSIAGEDATKNIVKAETQTPWFYWPGWLFLALTILVITFMVFSWYKLIYIPKYRGRKIAQ